MNRLHVECGARRRFGWARSAPALRAVGKRCRAPHSKQPGSDSHYPSKIWKTLLLQQGSSRHAALRIVILLATCLSIPAASPPSDRAPKREPKPWVTLEDCTYLPDPNNDGDSFRVRSGKKTFHFRLYFADAPETNLADPLRVADQAQYFGLSTHEVLKAGTDAAKATRDYLARAFTVRTRWTVAGGRSRQQRFYAFVEVHQRDLADWLVEHGWARAKGTAVSSPQGEPSKSITERLRRLEAKARREQLGAWSESRRPR